MIESTGSHKNARVSPDGRFLAYLFTPAQGGDIYDLYVQPYPSGPRVRVSTDGAVDAFWSPDGRQLFYKRTDGNSPLMAVSIQAAGPQIHVGQPEKLFDFDGALCGVTPDGRRFLMLQSASPEERISRFHLILHFANELRRLAPLAK
jgi:hypothetical protein